MEVEEEKRKVQVKYFVPLNIHLLGQTGCPRACPNTVFQKKKQLFLSCGRASLDLKPSTAGVGVVNSENRFIPVTAFRVSNPCVLNTENVISCVI